MVGDKEARMTDTVDATRLDGLTLMQMVADGRLPPPSISTLFPWTFTELARGRVSVVARAGDKHLNPLGGVHGGFAATILDSVTGCAAHTLLGPGETYGTTDLTVKMLRPVPRDVELQAVGEVISETRRLIVCQGRLESPEGKLLAHAVASCLVTRAG